MGDTQYSSAMQSAITRAEICAQFRNDVKIFCVLHDIHIKKLAKDSGVKYSSLLDATTGRSTGYEVIPIVREYMESVDRSSQN